MPTATNSNSLRATRHKPSALMPLPLSVTSIFSDVVAFRYENTKNIRHYNEVCAAPAHLVLHLALHLFLAPVPAHISLRRPLFASRDTSIPPEEAWKRDSGLARTTSSTTLFDDEAEDDDDDDRDKLHDIALYDKHFEAGVTVTTAPTPSPPSLHDTESVYSTDDQPEHPSLPLPLPIASVTSSTVSSIIVGESAPPPPPPPPPPTR
ncbi:hypothetical protein HYQ44_016555 [Verticillium longisporum]|nr:hypothetical protein HYQ44_016555 [Verticillium longisporum]